MLNYLYKFNFIAMLQILHKKNGNPVLHNIYSHTDVAVLRSL